MEELEEGGHETSVGFADHADAVDFVQGVVFGEGEEGAEGACGCFGVGFVAGGEGVDEGFELVNGWFGGVGGGCIGVQVGVCVHVGGVEGAVGFLGVAFFVVASVLLVGNVAKGSTFALGARRRVWIRGGASGRFGGG